MRAHSGSHRQSSFKFAGRVLAAGTLAITMAGSTTLGAYSQEEAELANTDARFLEVSDSVPEFGGAFVRDGSLHIWLTRPSPELRDEARAALIQAAGSEFDVENVRVLTASYSFDQLFEWHGAIIDVLSIEGVISTDIDDRSNRISIAVESLKEQASLVEQDLSEQGVPRAAVNIVQGGPVRAAPTPINGRVTRFWPIAIVVVALLGLTLVLRRSLSKASN